MTDMAIYDMDKTVTRQPTYTYFLLHCATRRQQWRLLLAPLVVLAMLGYLVRLVDRARLKEINHWLMIGPSISRAELRQLSESFADKTVENNLRPGALKAIERDKAQGRMVVMATASYRFYACVIAERLGFDHCIGTNAVEGLEERIHSRILGDNCYGPAKMAMILEWLAEHDLERAHVRFYSDHHTDEPVFEWADEAVAVNPSDDLAALARSRGWAIEDWG